MLSLGRGRGVSFRVGAESMSHFIADTTIAFLSLFPRARITEMRENVVKKQSDLCLCDYVKLMCNLVVTNLRGYHWLIGHKLPDMKGSQLFECSEICLLLAPDSPVTHLCFFLSGQNISGLSL